MRKEMRLSLQSSVNRYIDAGNKSEAEKRVHWNIMNIAKRNIIVQDKEVWWKVKVSGECRCQYIYPRPNRYPNKQYHNPCIRRGVLKIIHGVASSQMWRDCKARMPNHQTDIMWPKSNMAQKVYQIRYQNRSDLGCIHTPPVNKSS